MNLQQNSGANSGDRTVKDIARILGSEPADVINMLIQEGLTEASNPNFTMVPAKYVLNILGEEATIPPVLSPIQEPQLEPVSLAITDDHILDLAEKSGVELDVLIQAAEQVETLGHLCLWVEEYKRTKAELSIKESVQRRIAAEQLAKEQQKLGERLEAAIAKPMPDTAKIEQSLGLELPTEIEDLAKFGEWQKDFLGKLKKAVETAK